MSKSSKIALMSALELPLEKGEVPEWVHILPPPGSKIETYLGDGPYSYTNASELIAASMGRKARMVVDVNHSTYVAGIKGGESPARGYVLAMEERPDGIWAQIDWTESGRALMADRAYWGISPAYKHDRQGRILSIQNISLTNEPNMRGLTALNMETGMSLSERLAELCGLGAGATDDQIVEAVTALNDADGDDTAVALQSQLDQIGLALGVEAGAEGDAVLNAAKAAAEGGGDSKTVIALQSELKDVTTQLNSLRGDISKERAEAFVDGAIEKGHVGVKPMRDKYIAMHMEKPAETEELILAMPVLGLSGTLSTPPKAKSDVAIALNSEQLAAKASAYQQKLAEGGQEISISAAVRAVAAGEVE